MIKLLLLLMSCECHELSDTDETGFCWDNLNNREPQNLENLLRHLLRFSDYVSLFTGCFTFFTYRLKCKICVGLLFLKKMDINMFIYGCKYFMPGSIFTLPLVTLRFRNQPLHTHIKFLLTIIVTWVCMIKR